MYLYTDLELIQEGGSKLTELMLNPNLPMYLPRDWRDPRPAYLTLYGPITLSFTASSVAAEVAEAINRIVEQLHQQGDYSGIAMVYTPGCGMYSDSLGEEVYGTITCRAYDSYPTSGEAQAQAYDVCGLYVDIEDSVEVQY